MNLDQRTDALRGRAVGVLHRHMQEAITEQQLGEELDAIAAEYRELDGQRELIDAEKWARCCSALEDIGLIGLDVDAGN